MPDITRRDFLKMLNGAGALLGLGVVATPVVAYFYPARLEEMPSEPALVCAEAELPIGESKTVKFGRYPAIIVHLEEGLKAYSAVCTHFACLVKWNPEAVRLECPCHDGYFSPSDGSVVAGPPPAPLTPLVAEVVDGQVYVKVGES
ncbi:MAG: Rieske 2Fe-2S domain-containing protein [Chloroflexi bacterium]|nr:Rieske 2Fe-2S domain-containing protein [Chloroflexota bacterium]